MSPVIDIGALNFSYGSVPTLSGIDLQVDEGEFLGIVGPNAGDIAFISRYVSRVACVNRTLVCHRTDPVNSGVIQELYGENVRMIAHVR